VLFDSAEAFQNHNDVGRALCVILDINLNDEAGIAVRRRLKAAGSFISPPMTTMRFASRPGIRVYRLPNKAVLGEIADRVA
jgi:hypothetical protein